VERRDGRFANGKLQYNFLPLASSGRVTTWFPLFRTDVILISRFFFCVSRPVPYMGNRSAYRITVKTVKRTSTSIDGTRRPAKFSSMQHAMFILSSCSFLSSIRAQGYGTILLSSLHTNTVLILVTPQTGICQGRCKSTPSATELGVDVPAFEAVVEM